MNAVTIVGFGSVGIAALTIAAARRNHWFTLAFAFACAVAAACAFLADLWPLGIAGIVAYLVAMRRWIEAQDGVR